jgi:hypothetical protein
MKKVLLFSSVVLCLFSCTTKSPRETAQAYIKALYTSDLSTAATLTSTPTKVVLDKAQKQTKNTGNPEEGFQLSTLAETVKEDKANVKNNVVELPMVKEDGAWKVVLNESLLNEVQNHDEMQTAAKVKWEALQKEYEARLQVLKDYVNYKSSLGTQTPKLLALREAVKQLTPEKKWTGETLRAYVQKQQQLNGTIEDALEPSLAANTDLSLNYFVQISKASDRIRAAEAEYQQAAQRAHSPVYVPLPLKTATETGVSHN